MYFERGIKLYKLNGYNPVHPYSMFLAYDIPLHVKF